MGGWGGKVVEEGRGKEKKVGSLREILGFGRVGVGWEYGRTWG